MKLNKQEKNNLKSQNLLNMETFVENLSYTELLEVEGGNLLYNFGKAVGSWAYNTLQDVAEGKQTLMHSGAGYMLH